MKRILGFHKVMVLCLGFLLVGQHAMALGKRYVEKIKRIERTYQVDSNVKIGIDNKFGTVHIDTWDKNEVQLEIEIIVEDKNEGKASERLEDIDIVFDDNSPNSLHFKTIIDEKWWSVNPVMATVGIGQKRIEINYRLSIPINSELELENKYGHVYIGDLTGDAFIDIKYGNLKTERLTGENYEVELKYGKGEIEEIKNAHIDVGYSKLEIEKSESMEVESKYSALEMDEVDVLELSAKYGEVDIESVISLEGEFRYTDVKIGEVLNDVSADVGYGPKFEIEYISSQFEFVDIDANFTSVHLNFQENSRFELDAEASYGNINVSRSQTSVYKFDKEDHGNTEELEAIFGEDADGRKVNIDVSYGNISINKD